MENTQTCFTPLDLTVRWQCSLDVIYDLLRQKKLRGFKVGNGWRVTPENVRNYERGIAS